MPPPSRARGGDEMQLQMEAAETTVAGEAGVGGGGGERKRKKTLGRRKIEIKPIESLEARHVCFSKRRGGLCKKATELCALTGAKVAIIVFSPAGKPCSYGHPSVNTVVDRYLDPDLFYPGSAANDAFEAPPPPPPLGYEYDGLKDALDKAIAAEARRKDALDKAARAAGVWTEDTARQATMPELVAMLAALERVNDDIHMTRQCAAAAAAGACDAFCYDLGDGTSFTADNYGGASCGSRHQQAAIDAHMAYLMGGNGVGHAAAHAPMPLPPPDLPPVPLDYGSDHNHVTGYEGYAYDLGDGGGGHGAAYEMDGFYSGPTAATCNFFG